MTIYQVIPVTLENGEPDTICYAIAEYFQSETDARIAQSNYKARGMAAIVKEVQVK